MSIHWFARLVLLLLFPNLTHSIQAADNPPAAAKPPEPAKPSPMEKSWFDLENGENEAILAILQMARTPKESVEFLKAKMKPAKIDAEGVAALLVKLDSEDEKVWKAAFEELEYFDPRLAIDLQTLMENVTSKPLRQRMVEVIVGRPAGSLGEQEITLQNQNNGNFMLIIPNQGNWWLQDNLRNATANQPKKKWTRAARAILLLEFIKSPEAIAILNEMAAGHPDARPTFEAVAALKRIESTDQPQPAVQARAQATATPVAAPAR